MHDACMVEHNTLAHFVGEIWLLFSIEITVTNSTLVCSLVKNRLSLLQMVVAVLNK
jgi:hypothetical protein